MFVKLTLRYQPGTIFFNTKPTKIIYLAYGLFAECSADVTQMQGANYPLIFPSRPFTQEMKVMQAQSEGEKINSFQVKTLKKKTLLERRKKTINYRVDKNQ